MTQAAPTLAELSISLTQVQSLLRQLTAEVKVLSDGITVLAEQEENDLEEELDYLDVDPWSKAKDKDEADATTGGATGAQRQDSIRSLLQRRPSTVKDETKALARILSHKRAPASSTTANGDRNSDPEQQQQRQQQQQHPSATKWATLGLHDQVIDEDSLSSDGSNSGGGRRRNGDKQELDLFATADHNQSLRGQQAISFLSSATSSTATTPQPPEAERVPHTITVQTTQLPTKFSLAITKPSTPQSPSVHVLSTSSSQSSILSAMNMNNHSNNSTMKGQPSFWRSSTAPNVTDGSRPNSAGSNFNSEGYSTRGGVQNATHRRSLQPDSRSNSDSQTLTHSSVADRYTQALRTATQGMVIHPAVGKDTVKSTITVRSSVVPMAAAQVEKVDSTDCFSKLGLIPELLRGIYAYGLKMPSILQQRGIPMIMTRQDVLTQAKPEVAKTLTYAIPLLNFLTLPATSIHPQLLILCSNHDLCLHVQRVLLALARFMPTISCLILAEGSNATLSLGTISTTQVNVAAYGGGSGGGKNGHMPGGYGSRAGSNADPLPVIAAHVVIGTPGKVLGLIRTKQISIAALKVMVLENADILLASPLKEATISLLSMVRDPMANNSVGSGPGSSSGAAAASTSSPMISPPNSGPTSPVSMAVAALNGRIMGANNGGTSNGSMNRFSGSYGEPETRPRSSSNAASSTPPPQSLPNSMGTTKTPGINQPQLLFFSTEVPAHVLDYVAQYMTQPTKALVKGHELALKGTLQFFKYLTVEDEEWRLELLCELLEESGANRAVVFCNRDDSVSQVVRKIRERKGTAIGLYSDMDIPTRKAALGRFRSSPPQAIFVLTDEVARALEPDILAVPLVVSYEMPSIGNYVPRVKWIDRSNGKVGVKVVLIDGQRGEGQALRAIQSHYRTSIEDMPVSIAEFIVN